MEERKVDVAIIGAGTAGLTAFRQAEKQGKKVVLIDAGPFGTTCARVGCMPSKLLIAAAENSHHIDQAKEFGIQIEGKIINGQEVLRKLRAFRDSFTSYVRKAVDELDQENKLIKERATFIDQQTLRVGDSQIKAKAIVIATGSRAKIAKGFEAIQKVILTSEEVFEIENLPKSMLVVGTGVMGLELGQAFHRLGVETVFLGKKDRYSDLRNPEAIKTAKVLFNAELDLEESYELLSAQMHEGKAKVTYRNEKGKEITRSFEKVFMSVGRKPNLDQLALENAGVSFGEGDTVDFNEETLQIEDKPIFLAGDVSNLKNVIHEVSREGFTAGTNATNYPELIKIKKYIPFTITFTDPQIAMVGKSYREIEGDADIIQSVIDYEDQGRAKIMRENKGKVFLYASKSTRKFVGAELFTTRAENMGHLMAWCIELELTVDRILEMPFYHPVLEEGIKRGFQNLEKQLNENKG